VQRRVLAFLFTILVAGLVVVAIAALAGAHGAARWVIAFAAFALAIWLGSIALSALRR
jgi:hypothetical protein